MHSVYYITARTRKSVLLFLYFLVEILLCFYLSRAIQCSMQSRASICCRGDGYFVVLGRAYGAPQMLYTLLSSLKVPPQLQGETWFGGLGLVTLGSRWGLVWDWAKMWTLKQYKLYLCRKDIFNNSYTTWRNSYQPDVKCENVGHSERLATLQPTKL